MFRNPTTDLIVVLVVVLLIFGPKRLPGLGRSLGQGMREFKDSIGGHHGDEKTEERPEITASSPVPAPETQAPAPAQPAVRPETDAGSGGAQPEAASTSSETRS